MSRSRRHEIGVGLLVLVALALLGYMSVKAGQLTALGDTIRVTAELDDAAGLDDGAAVKVSGVQVGKVDGLRVEHDKAVIGLLLDKEAGLRRDVVVQVRARSVLGEKFLAVSPRSTDAELLVDGDVITSSRGQTEIDELVNALGVLLEGVDPEELSRSLRILNDALERDPDRVVRLLDDVETILDNAAQASADAPALVAETRAAVTKVSRVADEARPAVAKADAVLARLDEASRDLPATADEIEALVQDTRRTMDEARGTLEDGRRVVLRLEGKADEIEEIIDNLSEIDKWELRRLLREEGVVVRFKGATVVPTDEDQSP